MGSDTAKKHSFYFTTIPLLCSTLSRPEYNYYRTDYGPVTILTLDSSNGEPDDSRDNYGGEGQPPQISGQEYTGPGTDTQSNVTREQYEAAGGTDLADFNPGSPQWNWAIEQLESARAEGQIVFAQFHHAPYSSGTHGLPMNHEDSSGQGGTPMRQYHPLFEEYGVVAVFSGHSEMFERSFVDEDNDGEGVYYYDVGVAGDGMRGERTDADGNLLSYNPFSQWTADQSEPELWQEVDGVLQNVAGGKHYGHLEVNLENLGEEDGTRVTFTPVYSFPVLDANYELVDTERRVYGDEIVIDIAGETTLEQILGTDRSDTIDGTDADEIIFGGALRDRIDGGAGNDQIFGEDGRDVLSGGDGDDLINGGLLNNNVFGGAGSDTFVLVVGGDTRIRDFNIEEDVIGLTDGVAFGQLSVEKNGKNALISIDDEIALRVMNVSVDALTEAVFVTI